MTELTNWIFASYDPATEYRSSPDNPDITQRRIRASLTRYRLVFGSFTGYGGSEGTIVDGSSIQFSNGGVATETLTAYQKWICTEDRLDNEGGQGSDMSKQTQVWETFSEWRDWVTLEADLGISNPF